MDFSFNFIVRRAVLFHRVWCGICVSVEESNYFFIKMRTVSCKKSLRSFLNSIKNSGLNTYPCGTPFWSPESSDWALCMVLSLVYRIYIISAFCQSETNCSSNFAFSLSVLILIYINIYLYHPLLLSVYTCRWLFQIHQTECQRHHLDWHRMYCRWIRCICFFSSFIWKGQFHRPVQIFQHLWS